MTVVVYKNKAARDKSFQYSINKSIKTSLSMSFTFDVFATNVTDR